MSKALVTAAVLPSASRVGSPRPAARRVVFAFFFYCHRATTPFFLANTRIIIIIISSSSPNPFPHQVVERRRKDQTTKRKKIKSSPLSQKKGGPSCPFFVAWTQIFFFAQKISRSLLFFFSANTLNVLKNPKQKIQKESGVPQEKRLSFVCVSLSLSRLKSNHVARPKAEEQQQHTASSSSS